MAYNYNDEKRQEYLQSSEISWSKLVYAYGFEEFLSGAPGTAWEALSDILDGEGGVTVDGIGIDGDRNYDAVSEFSSAHNAGLFDGLLSLIEGQTKDGAAVEVDGKTIDFVSFFGTQPDSAFQDGKFIAANFEVNGFEDVAFIHFTRNLLNQPTTDEISLFEIIENINEYELVPASLTAFHRYNASSLGIDGNFENVKWTPFNGSVEYIFSGNQDLDEVAVITDPVNSGSYNFGSALDAGLDGFSDEFSSGLAHLEYDVWVWEAFGNGYGDPSTIGLRQKTDALPGFETAPSSEFNAPSLYTTFVATDPKYTTPKASSESDTLFVDANQRMKVFAGEGNDKIISSQFADYIDGGDGTDSILYFEANSGVAVNLSYGRAFYGAAVNNGYLAGSVSDNYDKLISIENAYGSNYGDILIGDSKSNLLSGALGNDILSGQAGDDILDGGLGEDTVVFNESRDSYSVFLNADDSYTVIGKTQIAVVLDGLDILNEVEKVRFSDGTFDITDLLDDAPIGDASETLVDTDGNTVGTVTIQAPTQDQGTEIELDINISTSGTSSQYRIALIMDVSGSMRGSNITEAQDAYVDLINYLKDQGIAAVTEFAVIPFNSSATLYEGLSADEAITQINALSAGGGTSFGPAIQRGLEFFDGAQAGLTHITYFLSDGEGSGATEGLQAVSDVRAFGIGSGASTNSLDTIDTNDAVILSSASDLAASFTESEIRTADIDKVEISVNGVLVDTVTGDQLYDGGATGLTYSGTVSGLLVSGADTIDAKVYFKDSSIPAQSVVFGVGDGVTEATGTDGDDNIAFSLSQQSIDAGGGTDTILANNLDNTIIKVTGNGVIKTFGGTDTIYAGDNVDSGLDRVIDGGDGVDTVVYTGNFAEYTISRTGGLIKVGTATDSLSNIEFLQFDDVKVRTSDLSVVQTLTTSAVEIVESDTGTQVSFVIKLDAPTISDVTFDYATIDGTAKSGSDFVASTGAVTMLAGEIEKTVTIDIIGDIIFENDEAFALQLSNVSGAVFDGGVGTYTAIGMIKNDDTNNSAPTAVTVTSSDIAENTALATAIGALAVTDPDAGDTHTLSLTDDAGGLFALDGTNLVVNGNLNFETAASHDITVRATDAAGLSVDQTLTVTVNNLLETFTGGTGDDEIMTGVGGDTINLGSGKDKVLGSVANFFDDQINGFSGDDQLLFVNEAVERQDITVMQGSAILAVDTNDDGSADGSFTLSGNFTAGDFMAVTSSNNTIVTFETFLPELQEGKSLDATLVNGVVNQEFLTGDGSSDFQVTLRDMGFAGYDNTIGVYEIDAGGNIIDTRILFENANSDKSAVAGITDVEAGNSLGFFIVQDAANWAGTLATGDTLSFVNNSGAAANISDGSDISIAVNGTAVDEMVFHSFSEDMNSDGVQHALSGVDAGGKSLTVSFEDLTGGGDQDYEDVVFRVEAVDDFMFV